MLQQKTEFSSARPLEPDQAYIFFWLASRLSRAFEPRKGHGKTACGGFCGYAPPTVPRAEYIRGCDN